jgi:glucose/mannose transport system substrate-binding protein
MALPGNLTGAIVDTVTAHFNSKMSSQEAIDRLVQSLELAKE